jgi:CubicO group peptidase (beta-lactamase class C family)
VGNARKERVYSEATRLLEAGVAGRVFPGAVACLGWRDDAGAPVYVEANAGKLQDAGPPTELRTPYDLASLTKPFVAMTALRLVAQGALGLDAQVEHFVADARGGYGGAVTLEQLLTHRAGLAAWGGLYLDVPHEAGTAAARRWIVGEASRRPDESPGAGKGGALYSDLGYILAGEVVARAAGRSLDRALALHVTEPLGIADEVYYAGGLPSDRKAALAKRAAPTERCDWRGRVIRGEVHDENCAALGGVSGHAGLFGTAHGVAVFGRAMLDARAGRSTFLSRESVAHALAPRPGSALRLGWDGKSAEGSTAGKRLSTESFGHLGFTGTSIWCDPTRDLVVVLLTNRVHPSRANERIKGFRPAFHDGVVGAFDH